MQDDGDEEEEAEVVVMVDGKIIDYYNYLINRQAKHLIDGQLHGYR